MFDMCIFDSELIDLDPLTHSAQFYVKVSFFLGQKGVCDTGDEAVMKIQKKIKTNRVLVLDIFFAETSEV